MRGPLATVTSILLLVGAGPALSQSAVNIGKFNDWGVYSYQAQANKICYALTVPTEKTPANLEHGDIFFFVSQRPGQNPSYEPQFIASYNFQENSKVSVTVDGKSFSMFTRGKSAWVENAADEPALVAAMKAGSQMKVAARSGRGNPTNYAFSLRGISAALTTVAKCK